MTNDYVLILESVADYVPGSVAPDLRALVGRGAAAGVKPIDQSLDADVVAFGDAVRPMDDEQAALMALLKRLPLTYGMISEFLVLCVRAAGVNDEASAVSQSNS